MGKRGPKQHFTDIACPNHNCPRYGVRGHGNIVGNGTYKAGGKAVRKYFCKSCGRTFNSRTGTIYEGLRSDSVKVDEAIEYLNAGISVKETAAKVDASPATVKRWYSNMASFAQIPPIFENPRNAEKIDDIFDEMVRSIDFSQVPVAMMRLQEKLAKLVKVYMTQTLQDNGIRPYHVIFILELGMHPHITQKVLCDILPVDRSRVSVVLRELISTGFVMRDGEERGSTLSLTPCGERAFMMCRGSWRDIFHNVFGELSEQQRGQIQDGLTALNAKLDEVTARISANAASAEAKAG